MNVTWKLQKPIECHGKMPPTNRQRTKFFICDFNINQNFLTSLTCSIIYLMNPYDLICHERQPIGLPFSYCVGYILPLTSNSYHVAAMSTKGYFHLKLHWDNLKSKFDIKATWCRGVGGSRNRTSKPGTGWCYPTWKTISTNS